MVDSLLKRWINGTHQGSISSKHLEFYLDEYAFRFNRKLSTYRGTVFYRLVQQAMTTVPVPLKILTSKENKLHDLKQISSFINNKKEVYENEKNRC